MSDQADTKLNIITDGVNKLDISQSSESVSQSSESVSYQSAKFVVNPIIKVDWTESDNSSSESYNSSDESSFNAFKENAQSIPYRTFKIRVRKKKKCRKYIVGKVNDKKIVLSDKALAVAQSFLNKLHSFGLENNEDSLEKIEDVVSVSMLLNRPLSISTRKNHLLEKESVSTTKKLISNIKVKAFGHFWEYQWYDTDDRKVEYKTVKTFYKKLKRYDTVKGTSKSVYFKNNSEIGHVPYQQLREIAKNHKYTKELIKNYEDCNVYLSLVDGDTVSFNGIYSAYSRINKESHYQNEEIPTVMSTGYEYPEDAEHGKALKLGSRIDRMIRVKTATHLHLSVYYPEPNTCVLVLPGHDTIEESFVDKKRRNGNLELPCLLKHIQESRNKDPETVGAIRAIFSDDNPLITTIPDRAKQNKRKGKIKFSDEFVNGHSPTQDDVKTLMQISQFNIHPLGWCYCLFINGSIKRNHPKHLWWCNSIITSIRNEENNTKYIPELKKHVDASVIRQIVAASRDVKDYIDNLPMAELDEAMQKVKL